MAYGNQAAALAACSAMMARLRFQKSADTLAQAGEDLRHGMKSRRSN
jgi:hypothetical protein